MICRSRVQGNPVQGAGPRSTEESGCGGSTIGVRRSTPRPVSPRVPGSDSTPMSRGSRPSVRPRTPYTGRNTNATPERSSLPGLGGSMSRPQVTVLHRSSSSPTGRPPEGDNKIRLDRKRDRGDFRHRYLWPDPESPSGTSTKSPYKTRRRSGRVRDGLKQPLQPDFRGSGIRRSGERDPFFGSGRLSTPGVTARGVDVPEEGCGEPPMVLGPSSIYHHGRVSHSSTLPGNPGPVGKRGSDPGSWSRSRPPASRVLFSESDTVRLPTALSVTGP